MARRMIPAKLEGQLQKFNSNISEDGKLYLDGIVDADGNPRFIEGDINTSSLVSQITAKYAKWSLSGSHLMIVVALEIENGATSGGVRHLIVNVPEWINNKIYRVAGDYIENKGSTPIINEFTSKVGEFVNNLNKSPDNDALRITYTINSATTGKGYVRIVYDLLINTEAGE